MIGKTISGARRLPERPLFHQSSGHQPNHGQMEEGFAGSGGGFVVGDHASVAGGPRRVTPTINIGRVALNAGNDFTSRLGGTGERLIFRVPLDSGQCGFGARKHTGSWPPLSSIPCPVRSWDN